MIAKKEQNGIVVPNGRYVRLLSTKHAPRMKNITDDGEEGDGGNKDDQPSTSRASCIQ